MGSAAYTIGIDGRLRDSCWPSTKEGGVFTLITTEGLSFQTIKSETLSEKSIVALPIISYGGGGGYLYQ